MNQAYCARLYSATLLLLFLISCDSGVQIADLVLVNGNIITLDEDKPTCDALAIHGDRIIANCDKEEIKAYIGRNTQYVDLKGKTAVPGLIDAHAHFTGVGRSKMILNLTKAANWGEILDLVMDKSINAEPDQWIIGRGWHQEKWDQAPASNVDGYPTHDTLSAISPNNPVLLTHASGHMVIANERAMKLAGVTVETPNPPGGEIVKDEHGDPIGVFREAAQSLIQNAYNQSRENMTANELRNEMVKQINEAMYECLSKGLTTIHDAGSPYETISLFKLLAETNQLKIRLWVMTSDSNERLQKNIPYYNELNEKNDYLKVRGVKRFMDGALGAHGAWLLEPYNDLPDSSGLNTISLDEFRETARIAIENDFQLCTHAIGDRANREVLDVYEAAFKSHPRKKDLRWRIEHAQHLNPIDIPRFGQLGVIASMQTCHCVSDAPYVIQRLGNERAEHGAYVWRSLMDTNALICNGTDAPVEDIDPIRNFHAAVTRRLKDGSTFFPKQKMIRMEALRSCTIDAAYAAFEEDRKGTLSPGKLADITVLSQDILTIPESSILQTTVEYTIVGGVIRYERGTDDAG